MPQYLLILLKAGEGLVEGGHVVQRVIGQALEPLNDAVCTTGNKNNHQLALFIYIYPRFEPGFSYSGLTIVTSALAETNWR